MSLDMPMEEKSNNVIVLAPEHETVGFSTQSLHEASDDLQHIYFTPNLDLAVASKIANSMTIGAVVVASHEFSDHAKKMLNESGIGLVVYNGSGHDNGGRCLVDRNGLTFLNGQVPVSAICSALNQRNLSTYRRFGVDALGYSRFKFCLFQLFSEEKDSYFDNARIEEYLYAQLVMLGSQGWSSIRCILSDLSSAELSEVGINVDKEVNPDMGLRGPRNIKQWIPELAAIRRFQEESDTPIKICAPFISSIEEYRAFVNLVAEAGIERSRVELGFTLEVPALAEELDELFASAKVDFMAIGTSDLFAFFNGIDRNNRFISVKSTSKANISLLRRVVRCAHTHGVHAFVCGEVRRNEEIMPDLLQNGIGELICSPRVEELTKVFRISASAKDSV